MDALYQLSYGPVGSGHHISRFVRRGNVSHPVSSVLEVADTATPSSIGARAEAAVASALVRAGKAVFLPAFAAHDRIDLVYLDGVAAIRVQCKTSRLVGDVLVFCTCSNTANVPRTYDGEIDAFGVYSPDTGLVYLVPAAQNLPRRTCSLRLTATRNSQAAGVRWAEDFVLGPP
jgi:PD-(D/E)XK endonuclease